jgi:hypothetical protein
MPAIISKFSYSIFHQVIVFPQIVVKQEFKIDESVINQQICATDKRLLTTKARPHQT